MSSIFLSYSSVDAVDAARIKDLLEARGYGAVFRDKDPEQGIPPGARWLSELFAAVERADIVVFLASPSSLASAWCQTELAYAVARGKFVVQASLRAVASHPLLLDRQAIGPIDDPAALVGRLVAGLAQTGHGPGDQFSWDLDQSPYPGLRRLTESDAAVLFGRDTERAQVLDRLAQPAARSVLVVGPSGSGKSSLVRAAVLPRLRLQAGTILLPVIEPGADPIGRVALELEQADPKIDAASIVDGRTTIAAAVDRLVAARGGRVVLFLDQAEDLVARAPQDQVARLAGGIGATDRERLVVIFALRSASLDAWLRNPALAAITPDDPVWVRPLDRSALRDVIVQPAALAGIRFEPPELVERILDDTEDGRALPLLAALLEELARGHTRETPAAITTERYEQVGPVRRIIERRAAEATRDVRVELGLGEDAAVAAYLRLVEIDDDGQPTRSEVAVEDLPPGDLAILAAFERQRLVTRDARGTTSGGEVLAAVHEEVFRAWPALVAAIDGRRADLQVRTRIRRDADGWLTSGRGQVPLTGGRLEVALDWSRRNPADLTDAVRRYLAAARRQRMRRRILATAVPILALVAIGVAALAIQANGARLEAEALRLAADSRAALDDRLDLGLLLALQAHARSNDMPAQSAVLVGLTRGAGPERYQDTGGPIVSGALDATGTHAVLARPDATVLWDVAQARAIDLVPGAADAVAISADGGTVALARPGTVEIRRWTGGTTRTCSLADAGDARLHVSDDGRLVVAAVDTSAGTQPSHVTVLSSADCGTSLDQGSDSHVEAIDLDSTGALLALGTVDGGVVVWDASTGEPLDLAQPDDVVGIQAVAVGDDGRLAGLTDDGALLVWDDVRSSGQPPARLRVVGSERQVGTTLRFRPDGSTLLVGGSDGEVVAVDPQSDLPLGAPMRSLPYLGYTGAAGILDLAVTDSGPGTDDVAITVDPSGRLVTWDLAGRPRLSRQILEGVRVDRILSRPDGSALAAGGSSAWLLDGPTGAVTSRNDGLPGGVTALAARDDTVVIGTDGGDVLVTTTTLDGPRAVRSGGGRPIVGLAVLPDGSIASVDDGGILDVVSAAGAARSTDLGVRAASMAADGSHLFVGAADGSVRVVDPSDLTRAPIRVPGHAADVTAVAVRPDGRALATGSDDRAISVWSVAPDGSLALDKRLLGHGDKVTSLSWSGDGRWLASSSEDHHVILWDVASGLEIGDPIAASGDPAISGTPAVSFAGTPDRQLLVATADGLARWDMRPDEWVRISWSIVAGRTFSDIERQRYLQGGQPADAGCR